MTIAYFLTDAAGRIAVTGRCAEDQLGAQARPGLTAHAGYALPGSYYDAAAGFIRPLHSWTVPASLTLAADGQATASVTGIPPGSRCLLSGPTGLQSWTEGSGAIEITTTVAGSYTLLIDPPQHERRTIAIEATP